LHQRQKSQQSIHFRPSFNFNSPFNSGLDPRKPSGHQPVDEPLKHSGNPEQSWSSALAVKEQLLTVVIDSLA